MEADTCETASGIYPYFPSSRYHYIYTVPVERKFVPQEHQEQMWVDKKGLSRLRRDKLTSPYPVFLPGLYPNALIIVCAAPGSCSTYYLCQVEYHSKAVFLIHTYIMPGSPVSNFDKFRHQGSPSRYQKDSRPWSVCTSSPLCLPKQGNKTQDGRPFARSL